MSTQNRCFHRAIELDLEHKVVGFIALGKALLTILPVSGKWMLLCRHNRVFSGIDLLLFYWQFFWIKLQWRIALPVGSKFTWQNVYWPEIQHYLFDGSLKYCKPFYIQCFQLKEQTFWIFDCVKRKMWQYKSETITSTFIIKM